MGLYIAFEGGEGSGKSTQLRRLARWLTQKGELAPVVTHEPGATPLGGQLRQLLLGVDEAPVGPRAETLMMAADRAQHMADVVRPALAEGRHVLSDRTAYSSLAYQGGGRQLGVEDVRAVNNWALDGLWPDLVLLLDCTPAAAAERRSRALDRLEAEADSFHERIHATFAELAAAEPDRWAVIDGSQSIDDVAAAVRRVVGDRLEAS